MAGYSSTPLERKLGLDKAEDAVVLHAPAHYGKLLPDHFPAMHTKLDGTVDWLQAFYTAKNDLVSEFTEVKKHLSPAGQLWIAWPKKSSSLESDLNENIIRQIGLDNGLVDVKVAAIDEDWSGLKFVFRLKDRK